MWSTSSRFRFPISPLGYAPIRTPLFLCPFICSGFLYLISAPVVKTTRLKKPYETPVFETMVQRPVKVIVVYELVVFPAIGLRKPLVFRIATHIHLHPLYAVNIATPRDAAARIHDGRLVHMRLHNLHDGMSKPFPRMIVFILKLPHLAGIGLSMDSAAMMFGKIKLPYHPLHLLYRSFRVSLVSCIESADLPALLGLVASLGVFYSRLQVVLIVNLLEKESYLLCHTLCIVKC